jgi:predicted metal-dependent phosphoesterase TrpH
MLALLADLHLHTTESDGTWTPEELVRKALQVGLSAIAICDHDTTSGIKAATGVAPPELQVIPGIELSTSADKDDEVHILGLWINPHYEALQRKLADLRKERVSRVHMMIERLESLGFSLAYADVLKFAHEDVLSRSHIAAAMVEKGIVGSKHEAFDAYLGQGQPAYVKRHKLTLEEAVRLILEAGGVPILAHPGLLKDLTILPRLVQAGLVGMEVIHHSHTKEQTEFFRQMAKKNGLLPSGGSDCHGPGGKDEIYIGKYSVPWHWLEDLAASR